MADEWDSSPVWLDARERARAEVQAAFAPKAQTCPSCGREEATASRTCPHCGASYVVVQPKMSKRTKLGIAGGVVALLIAGAVTWVLVSPSINHTKKANAERAAAEKAAFIRSEKARLKADQRLQRGAATTNGEGRAALVTDLENAISADARSRVKGGTINGPIRRTECQPVTFGRLVPNAVRGGYQCVAVSENIPPEGHGATAVGGILGYPFWAVVNYRQGSFAWCKVNPKPGEMATQSLEPVVNPPAACNVRR